MMGASTTELIADADGERLDVFVARVADGLTRSRAQKLIDDEMVLVEGECQRASYRLSAGERVSVTVPEVRESEARPESIALDVIYEDADIIAINKPAGMTVHPAPGHPTSTLVNAILAHCKDLSGVGGVLRPGIVHRLDRDTSGVILVAKNDEAHNALAKQLKERAVEKTYLALVEGTPKPPEGVIDAPIARDPRNRQRMAVIEGGRESVTAYTVVERLLFRGGSGAPAEGCSLVEARPKTGRTHQIRVHLAAIGHPIVGDRVYGKPSKLVMRQFLHAARIAFTHPRTGERMELQADLPDDLSAVLIQLRS
jgi:23S rRNA pseudouridine1911/1915/1917 synthase